MLDVAIITVAGGNGGDGMVSFRRERAVPLGGPDGGDGGRGGSVFMVADGGESTLGRFRHHDKFEAQAGRNGGRRRRHGRKGGDVRISVPCGTEVWTKTGDGWEWLGEVLENGQEVLLARGGEGGRGNARFATPTQQVPYLAERGRRGEACECRLELKLLADVGIVGKPNAGKSTLLSVVSKAKPQIASYEFTTVEPQLGVARVGWKSVVLAEIPGLVKGAHAGVGLGEEFLRHATRTQLLLHVVDGSLDDVSGAVCEVNDEMAAYGGGLEDKPQIVVVNKIDLPDVIGRRDRLQEELGWIRGPVRFISAAAKIGVDELMEEVAGMVEAPKQPVERRNDSRRVGAPERHQTIRVEDGVFVVDHEEAERLVAGSDLRQWAGRVQVKLELDRMGVTRALEDAGIRGGDTVRFGDIELEW